jgi:hypothetical protein
MHVLSILEVVTLEDGLIKTKREQKETGRDLKTLYL